MAAGGAEASAPIAAQVINAFVTKQRKRDNNIRIADTPKTGSGSGCVFYPKAFDTHCRVVLDQSGRLAG